VQTGARLAYYGEWLPNTYYLKVTGIPIGVRLDRGFPLLATDAVANFGPYVVLAAAAVAVAFRRRDWRVLPLVGIVLGAAAYSVWAGGDAVEDQGFANRFLSTAAPVLMVLAGLGIAELVALARRGRIAAVVVVAAVAAAVVWVAAGAPEPPATARTGNQPADWLYLAAAALVVLGVPLVVLRRGRDGSKRPAWAGWALAGIAVAVVVVATNQLQYRTWADSDVAAFEQSLTRSALRYRHATTPDAVIAFGAAGSAYFTDRRAIDLLGLSDAKIARQPPRNPVFRPGHDKYDYDYSIGDLRPDVVGPILPVPKVTGYVGVPGHLLEEVLRGSRRVDLRILSGPQPS
jgi:hypothetical protein